MICAEDISKIFYSPRGRDIEAVRGVSLRVDQGEILGLLGPNGAGKTTLLRILATIIKPSSGSCEIDGLVIDESPNEIRRHIGFLSGNTKLYGRLTATEMLRYFGRLFDMVDKNIERRIEELAELLGMTEFLDQRCDTLSTGQSQKVSIARTILHSPQVLILDEPTLGLDIMTSRTILDFIRQAKTLGHSILFSTHLVGDAELLCDRIALMHNGSFLKVGTPEELREQTGTDNLVDAFQSLVEMGAEKS
ncbi:ATP-binding cassette domain-containing protein [Candidatus Hydrogenedentota bacterium]